MNVWTIQPRCWICRLPQWGQRYGHKFSCNYTRMPFLMGQDLPRRDPGRSLRQPWLAKWPREWRREKKLTQKWLT